MNKKIQIGNLSTMDKTIIIGSCSFFIGFIIGFILNYHISFNEEAKFWVPSTIIQALAALIALVGMFYIYRLGELNRIINDEENYKSSLESKIETIESKIERNLHSIEHYEEDMKTKAELEGLESTDIFGSHYKEYLKKEKKELEERLRNAKKELHGCKEIIKGKKIEKKQAFEALGQSLTITGAVIILSFFILPFGDTLTLKTNFAKRMANMTSGIFTPLLIADITLAIAALLTVVHALGKYIKGEEGEK